MPGWTHTAFPIGEPSRIGEARRHAAARSGELSFGDVEAGQLALVVNELGTNLLKHAQGGHLLIAARPEHGDVEVLSVDCGPGMADIRRSLEDGYSTAGTKGTGLGAVKRLSREFALHSRPGEGTLCLARVGRMGGRKATDAAAAEEFEYGAVCVPAPGERVSGDSWSVAVEGSNAAVLIADGLGHGPDAAKASLAAAAVFDADPFASLRDGIGRIHTALQATRGAAVCVANVDAAASSVRYAGAGNIVGRIVSGLVDRSLATQHGTAGVQIRRTEESTSELPPHALLVVHSDGLETRWTTAPLLPLLQSHPALLAAALWRAHSRRRDDVSVVVLRRKEAA
ncbi:ATP-binding SpoIIE family protein phosphatase [Variovorax ureilyticus]|uniref:ATP-binding SpoIIE family protein phosphatase n=1 Tax=Variovorax ureilyticus TaxID=1836198 RepID=A0ABU8VIA0_9BURK